MSSGGGVRVTKEIVNLNLDLSSAGEVDAMASSIATFFGFSSMPKVSKQDRAVLESVVYTPSSTGLS